MVQLKHEQDYIVESKRKCVEAGMDPNEIRKPKHSMSDLQLLEKRHTYQEILSVVDFFSKKILDSLSGTPVLIVISDENGYLLHMVGDETIRMTINQLGIEVGAQFTQEDMGTNVVSLSLQQNHPIQLIGSNHYHTILHGTACYGVAFRYTDINNLLGSICIMTATELHNPFFLTMLSTVVDSIERELLLRKQNRKLNMLNQIMVNKNRNGIIITNADGVINSVNDFVMDKFNIQRDSNIVDRAHQDPECLVSSYMKKVIQKKKSYDNVQMILRTVDNQKLVCLFDAQPIYDETHNFIGSYSQLRDITERYLNEERHNYLAYHDELTSLPNRRSLQETLNYHISSSLTSGKTIDLVLMFLDLDHFKTINDAFGHSNGDILLKQVSSRLILCLGDNGKVFRMGGDEFIFLFHDINGQKDVIQKGRQIIDLFDTPFTINGSKFHVTASIGIAIYPNDGTDAETFMVYADNAMYKSKSKGRNNYTLFDANMKTHSKEKDKLSLEVSLRRALENKEFVVYYQPQVDLVNKKIIGVEALLRWDSPEYGIVSPVSFIPILEENGLISQVGEWVLSEVCNQSKRWIEQGFPKLRMAVNLSSQQFLKDNLVEVIANTLIETGMDPNYLELEITETMTMDVERAITVLGQLNALGVRISIDDFGTGYSSLNYLKKFPIHTLKIDKSFVRDIMIDVNDSNIVSTIISMAHNLNLDVVAEGVETKDQLDFLQLKKCDAVQGYYYSKPLSVVDFEKSFYNLNNEIKMNSTNEMDGLT
ncbi:diguanylate cyclase [Paenibacillus pectinilyticus]|uniref:Diguanylate cyclase n=1 Tax=Paenibacillus pectinilyticus TaxID=512399 RepID=A0A1C1A7M7_9BACL|nr:EAL domain-containing protein [Paenibacillus pectinilyticus]OCT16498.1 diguanylate cyclase [Paenibacillus pectinilyticus]